jgi:hypothetical protein
MRGFYARRVLPESRRVCRLCGDESTVDTGSIVWLAVMVVSPRIPGIALVPNESRATEESSVAAYYKCRSDRRLARVPDQMCLWSVTIHDRIGFCVLRRPSVVDFAAIACKADVCAKSMRCSTRCARRFAGIAEYTVLIGAVALVDGRPFQASLRGLQSGPK